MLCVPAQVNGVPWPINCSCKCMWCARLQPCQWLLLRALTWTCTCPYALFMCTLVCNVLCYLERLVCEQKPQLQKKSANSLYSSPFLRGECHDCLMHVCAVYGSDSCFKGAPLRHSGLTCSNCIKLSVARPGSVTDCCASQVCIEIVSQLYPTWALWLSCASLMCSWNGLGLTDW